MARHAALLVLGAGILAVMCAGAARAEDTYGAIAYSAPSDSVHFRIKCWSRAECEEDALKSCREGASHPDACEVLLWFRDACGAFARAGNGAYGTGWGDSQEMAKRYAIATCQDHGGEDCVSKTSACSSGAFTLEK